MKHGLPLLSAAIRIALATILFNLGNMPLHGKPPLDLPLIFFREPSAHVIPAIPLKPTARVCAVDPSLFLPHGKRLTGIHAKIIALGIMFLRTKPGFFEPIGGKLFFAIRHVFTAKDA